MTIILELDQQQIQQLWEWYFCNSLSGRKKKDQAGRVGGAYLYQIRKHPNISRKLIISWSRMELYYTD